MSRNLCQRSCDFCREPEVTLVEEPRLVTREDAGRYFDEYAGMLVANAECEVCGGKYLAWVDERSIVGGHRRYFNQYGPRFAAGDDRYFDLSFRSTFNDEAGPDDLPTRCASLREANAANASLRTALAAAEAERDTAVARADAADERCDLHFKHIDAIAADRDQARAERDAVRAKLAPLVARVRDERTAADDGTGTAYFQTNRVKGAEDRLLDAALDLFPATEE